jgi:hypothetical protein
MSSDHKYIEGKGGYLFLDNDTNYVISQTTGEYVLDESHSYRIVFSHLARSIIGSIMGFSYFHIIAPNKETILSNLLPDNIVYEGHGETPVRKYLKIASRFAEYSLFFDPEILRDNGPGAYTKTDTHWTHQGAISYFIEFLRLHSTVDYEHASVIGVTYHSVECDGDLGKHAGFSPEPIMFAGMDREYELLFEGNIINNGYVRHTKSESSLNRKVLVIHDSFGQSLYDFLSVLYSEVIFIHMPHVDMEFIRRLKPDVIYYIQVERFLISPPSNEINIERMISEQAQSKGVQDITTPYLNSILIK